MSQPRSSNEQANELHIFLANTEKRNGKTEPYLYRWLAPAAAMTVQVKHTSYERSDHAWSDLPRGYGPYIRIFNLYVLRTQAYEQVQLSLTPLGLTKPVFTSTLRDCPHTNCNNTYVYRRNQTQPIEISLADVNGLRIDFGVDFVPGPAPILVEFESFANLAIDSPPPLP
ncbi:MAG: hypothetical protein E6Q06_02070 [Candidatus Moraniibacteriota bacterium]|nr:MAG: hypothetical protein E6Q06_02070 [Candidatus Moranbacteria bacterium]